MAMFAKHPCSFGDKCVALHAELHPINQCKKCKAQLHPVAYQCSIPATEVGVSDPQGDCIICHRCANMVKCASNNCLIKINKVATTVFFCIHDKCKNTVHSSCAKGILQKMEQDIPTDNGKSLYFCGQRHGDTYFKAIQAIDTSKTKPINKTW